MNQIRNKTKIVATLGPSSNDYETIKKLVLAGVSMFRINTSHGEKEEHAEKIKIIRQVSEELNQNIPILIDLQGPKIRVGQIPEPIEIKKGQEIILEHTDEIKEGNDLVIGSRFIGEKDYKQTKLRMLGINVISSTINFMTDTKIMFFDIDTIIF